MSIPPEQVILQADALGFRLELVRGLPLWEAQPVYRHQKQADRIRSSIVKENSDCACEHVADVLFRFADGSLKRPDISILCREPDEAEQDSAITLVPEAVIEIISAGYEAKDLEIGPQFYLAQGVKDVIVFDPRTLTVLHYRCDGINRLTSPASFVLECGCTCVV